MDRNPLPEPPSKIGGLASAPNPPKRGIAGAIDYEFSHDFPQGARDQVKKEEIRVAREFTKEADTARTVKDLRALRMRCAMSLALAFCREAVQLRWSADRIDSEFREFILAAGNWAGLEPTSVSQLEFEQTTEWREYQNLMLASGEGAASQEVEEERLATKVLGSSRPVSLVRHPGTAQEVRLARRMGGDFRKLALFLPDDRVEIADELLCDIFDEPRIVAGVEAIVVQHRVFRWEAQILPRSEWNRRHGFGSLSVDPGSRPAATYPLAMHHPAKESVTVYSAKEEAGLGAGWSRVYIHRAYPKCKYHWNGKNTIVKNLDEELALGGGWAGTPAAFEAYRGPRRAIPDRSNPIKWVDDWTPAGVSADLRIKIKAQLKRAHGAFWKSPDAATAITHSMRLAFDGIAKVLFDARVLTENLLSDELPTLIWDSAVAGGWWHLASETPHNIFPEQLGHYWVWLDDSQDWASLFRGEISEWEGNLLEASAEAQSSHANAGFSADEKTDDDVHGGASSRDKDLGARVNSAAEYLTTLPGFHAADVAMREASEPILREIQSGAFPRLQAMAWFDAHAGSYLCLVIDQPSWKAYRVLLHDLWYPQAYEYLFGRTTIFPEPKGIALADELHERLREAHKRASEALARRQALSSDSAPVPAKVGTDRIEPKPTSAEQKTITTDGVASVDLPTPKIAFEERATWFQNELAKRDWNVHELQGQGGPNWKTSRKILDGLPVSRGVLERVAIALSKKKHPVRFKEIPEE